MRHVPGVGLEQLECACWRVAGLHAEDGHAGESWALMVLSGLCMGKETMLLTMHVGVQRKKETNKPCAGSQEKKERKASDLAWQ